MARQIEHPGHASSHSVDAFLAHAGFQRDRLRTRDGVRIAYWIAPPRTYHVKDEYQVQRKGKHASFSFNFSFEDDPAKAPLLAPKGSVVLLHPWSMSGAAMSAWGIHFAAAGYQVVMPDLRSQGKSSDAPVGYGPREASDIIELVRDLQAKRRLPGPLYVLGISYGATVALFAAPQLPGLRGVMALEPYANAAAVIRRAPASGLFGYNWLAHWITPREIDAAIARAGRKLDVNLEQIDPGDALARTPVCTLILRGSRDVLTSAKAVAALSRRSSRVSYVEVPGEGHLSLPMRTAWLVPPLLGWMQALPDAGGPCPVFSLPPATQTATSPGSAGTAAGAQPR
ncbi:MAG TPA: alpha/beta fold hydrolase [Rhodanobacter sp.]|nr:alpha/beta fold hydrolase [Rhodanobacter sp.]